MGLHTTLFLLSILLICASFSISGEGLSPKVGVCYGQLGNNLPSPSKSVQLIQGLKGKSVKIYDANPKILKALKGTDLQVSIMVPDDIIPEIGANQTAADQWVKTNAVPYYPKTKIRYLLVGNEMLSFGNITTWSSVVPAMRKVRAACKIFGLQKIKVGTPLAMDVLESSFPPSNGTFRSDVSESIMKPMLRFLDRTKSFFFIDTYPYFAWSSQPTGINLDYALLASKNLTYTDPVSGLTYTNLLDQMLDANIFAMKKLGYPNIRLFVAETGWPSDGDINHIGCNIYNAATYNRNAARKFSANPPLGTPARPGVVIPAFIFALYNENQKTGPGTERHFGLLYPNGTDVYGIDLSGKTPDSAYKPLPKPKNNELYKGKVWCVVSESAMDKAVAAALSYACGQGNGTCDPIQPGGKCYKPNSLAAHASYAFSAYWAKFKKVGGTCSFHGAAVPTAKDPSHGNCKYPSVYL